MQVKTWIISRGRVWFSLEWMRQKLFTLGTQNAFRKVKNSQSDLKCHWVWLVWQQCKGSYCRSTHTHTPPMYSCLLHVRLPLCWWCFCLFLLFFLVCLFVCSNRWISGSAHFCLQLFIFLTKPPLCVGVCSVSWSVGCSVAQYSLMHFCTDEVDGRVSCLSTRCVLLYLYTLTKLNSW